MDVEVRQLEQTALAWPDRARGISITDQQTYDMATTLLVEIATIEKRIKDHHKPIKDAAFAAHKTAVAAEKKLLDPLDSARGIIKTEIVAWERKQEAIRQEMERKALEDQRRAEEEARLAVAVEAEKNGAPPDTVQEILDQPVALPTPVVAPTFQRAQGVSTQERWHAEVTDIKALCKAVGDGRASSELVTANMVALNSMARAMKQTFSIPGCRAIPETTIAVRSAV